MLLDLLRILRYLFSNKFYLLNIGFPYPNEHFSPFHFLISRLNISKEGAVL